MEDIQACLSGSLNASYIQLLLAPEVSLSTVIIPPSQLKILLREVCLFFPAEGRDQEGASALPFPLSEHSGGLFSAAGKGAEGVLSDCSQACALPSSGSPSPRWCHAMCLSDLGTAVLIGGEGSNQQSCRDALWKLEIGGNFRVVKARDQWYLRIAHADGRGYLGFCAYGGDSITSGMSPG